MTQIDLKSLMVKAGSEEGARVLFQRLIGSIVRCFYKDARDIRCSPGDWGIDVLLGDIGEVVSVWQAKYFIHGVGESQKSQIRESFKTLMKKSEGQNFKVDAWTLCISCDLSPEETKWWETWKKKAMRNYSLTIQLMDEGAIRSRLESPDAELVREGYFGANPAILNYLKQVMKQKPDRDIQTLPEQTLFEESLFVRKLRAADIKELASAKTQFFNAELLIHEVFDKGDESEISAIRSLAEKLRTVWETRYNDACLSGREQKMKRLYPETMKAIESMDKTALHCPLTQASLVHKQGIVHQLADKCEVGWTENFRSIVKEDS
jgi:hypothetical protein